MQEIEIRALVDNPEYIAERLIGDGFIDHGDSLQRDIMLDKPDASLFRSGQKIRIRSEGPKCELTFKGIFEGDQTASRRVEVNVPIAPASLNDVVSLFSALGFPICFQIPKLRSRFSKNDLNVTLDRWPIIGCLMEVEGPEVEAKALASAVAPGVAFGNPRLKDLFRHAEERTGLSLSALQETYEREHSVSLGRLDLLLS